MKKWLETIVLTIMITALMAMVTCAAENNKSSMTGEVNAYGEVYADSAKTDVAGYWHFADGVLSYTADEAGSINPEEINKADVKKVVIGSGPTKYKGSKCSGYENLEEVVYEAPITNREMCVIGSSMFSDCPKLKKVTVGKSREGSGLEFDKKAFYNCPSLTDVSLGTGIWHFGRQTFGDCINLTSFRFPDDMHDVRGDSFWGCENLANVSIASTNKFMKVDHNAVYEYFDPYQSDDWGGATRVGAYITPCLVFVPEGVVKQNNGSYTVTKGIKDIQFWAFMGDKSLKQVTLASTVESIQLEAFLHCENLQSITLPRSLKRVGQNAFSPNEPHGFEGTVNVNENLKDIYYQGSEDEWKQIELATYKLDEGHINRMSIASRGEDGNMLPGYQKEYLYNNLEKAGIPANVTIHYNSELVDTAYSIDGAKNDDIYQETKLGAPDDNCYLEKKGKVWELQYLNDSDTYKITVAKGNKFRIQNFASIVSGDVTKMVSLSKKGILSAKKDTKDNLVSVKYNTLEGKTITLNIRVIQPVFLKEVSVSANAVSANAAAYNVTPDAATIVKKLNITASLRKGQTVDRVLSIPDNFYIYLNKVYNKGGVDCTLKKEADGRIHLKAQFTKKGTVKIPVYVNGKVFRVKLTIKK